MSANVAIRLWGTESKSLAQLAGRYHHVETYYWPKNYAVTLGRTGEIVDEQVSWHASLRLVRAPQGVERHPAHPIDSGRTHQRLVGP